jgi:hypothetical protein
LDSQAGNDILRQGIQFNEITMEKLNGEDKTVPRNCRAEAGRFIST